jgi:DNA-binding transcriptional LysR family regulator
MGGVPAILTQTISRFKGDNPNVHLSIQLGTSDMLLPELLRGDLDVVLGRLPDHYQSDEFDITFLEGEAMSIVARPGHPLFQRAKLNVSDMVNETWILHPSGSPMRRRVEAALRSAQLVTSLDIIETSSILATTSLMEASDMVSVIPLAVAQHYATYGILKIFPVALPLPMAQLGIITPKRKDQSPAMKGFLECLTEIFMAHHQNLLPPKPVQG